MGSKSKKGSSFERSTLKELSLWFSKGERDDIFWRTAGSGARATTRAKVGKMTADSAGDMAAIHRSGKSLTRVSIWELKRGYSSKAPSKNIEVLTLIDSPQKKPSILESWVNKIEAEMKAHKRKFWFIIFRRDRKNSCICMAKKTFDRINKRNDFRHITPPFGSVCQIYIGSHEQPIYIMTLKDFFAWCNPETLIKRVSIIAKSAQPKKMNKRILKEKMECYNKNDHAVILLNQEGK